jgi:uncharacterized membrane protein
LFLAITLRLQREGLLLSALLTLIIGSNVASLVAWDHYFVIVVLVPLLFVSEIPIASMPGVFMASSFLLFLVPWWRFRYGPLNHSWSHALHVSASMGYIIAIFLFLLSVSSLLHLRENEQNLIPISE